jgi:hypothetical protein
MALPFVTVFLRRYARYFGLQVEMYARLRDKSKHRYQRPGQNAGLLTRQFGNNLAPIGEPGLKLVLGMKQLV